jgi:hypothetical protein
LKAIKSICKVQVSTLTSSISSSWCRQMYRTGQATNTYSKIPYPSNNIGYHYLGSRAQFSTLTLTNEIHQY